MLGGIAGHLSSTKMQMKNDRCQQIIIIIIILTGLEVLCSVIDFSQCAKYTTSKVSAA